MAGVAPGGSGAALMELATDEMTRVDAGEHAEEPITSDSVPRAQVWQAPCPPSEKVLRGQARQSPREGEGAVPGAQRTQASGAYEAFNAAKPTAHGVEFVLPRGQYELAGHCTGVTVPGGKKLPAGTIAQLCAPAEGV